MLMLAAATMGQTTGTLNGGYYLHNIRTLTVNTGPAHLHGSYYVIDTRVNPSLTYHYVANNTLWPDAMELCPLLDPAFTGLASFYNDEEWTVR
jgi:hypothetical protein